MESTTDTAQEAQQADEPAPPSRYPNFKDAHAAIAYFRNYKIKNMSREDKENERVALDYVTRGIFVPQILVTLVFQWNRTPTPNTSMHQHEEDCVAMIEAYMEYHGSGTKLRKFFMELELFPEIDTDYRLAHLILKEASFRQLEERRLGCFAQALLNIYNRRDMGNPRIDGSIQMKYVCISIYTLLTPLLPKSTIQTMRLLLGDGGFIIRSSLSAAELREVAMSWGKYMRMQIYRYAITLESLIESSRNQGEIVQEKDYAPTAQEQGNEILEALMEVLDKPVRKRGELHKVVWNLGWEMRRVELFWGLVGEGVRVEVEEWNGPLGMAETSWFVKAKVGDKNEEEGEGV